MILCVAANPSIDVLYRVPTVQVGCIHRPTEVTRTAGGKGLNVARTLHSLGADVRAVVALGGHSGAWIRDQLQAAGIAHTVVDTANETRTCVSVSAESPVSLTEWYEPGLDYHPGTWTSLIVEVAERVVPGSWVSISGSLPVGTPPEAAAELVAEVRAAGGLVAVDVAAPWLPATVAAGAALVKVNEDEARTAMEWPASATLDDLLSALAQDGATVVVSLGKRGAVMRDDADARWRVTPPEMAPYPVGSGDALLAGLLSAKSLSTDWQGALRVGVAAATANALVPGAGRLDLEAMDRLHAAVQVAPYDVTEL